MPYLRAGQVVSLESTTWPGTTEEELRPRLPGRGKRGGARVIYYHWASHEHCDSVYAYAKNVADDLTNEQLRRLADAINAELEHGR